MELARVRPTWVEVDLDAIAHNVKQLVQLAPRAQFMAVVKADGYGHGAIPVAKTALAAGASWLGVATVEEGVSLRREGILAPILIFGFVPPDQADTLLHYDLRPSIVGGLELATALSVLAVRENRPARVHLKVDTGMGRVGVRPHEAVGIAQTLAALPAIEVEGIFTHLATADEPENDFAGRQLAIFDQVLDALREVGITPPVRHACNSAGIMLHPEGHHDLVRAGIALYGLEPDPAVTWPVLFRPALTWKTHVTLVKTVEPGTSISYGCTYRAAGWERIASLPVGYADGYSRHLSNKGEVLISGRRCPVVGRVCMDQMMVRVPDELELRAGTEVILIGEQGGERITAADMARSIGTINYEIVCGISKRVPRLYRRDGNLLQTGIL